MARQRFVNGVVRHLENHMVQARPVIGVADIHAGPFADRIEALEDLDRVGTVFALLDLLFGLAFRGIFGSFAHADYIGAQGA